MMIVRNISEKSLDGESIFTSTPCPEILEHMESFFWGVGNRYWFIANNKEIDYKTIDLINKDDSAWVVQFNKAIHNERIKNKRKAFFYNGNEAGGLWGFDGSRLEKEGGIGPGFLHFCFNVDVTGFNLENDNLNLTSLSLRPALIKAFDYPRDKVPSVGFLGIAVLMFLRRNSHGERRDNFGMIGFTGASVLSEHHATLWEQSFIKGLTSTAGSGENKIGETEGRKRILLSYYESMHKDGYLRSDGKYVPAESAFASFELLRFLDHLDISIFRNASVLDYGSGKSSWEKAKVKGVPLSSLLKYREVNAYEPAAGQSLSQAILYDIVVCMDVAEHVYVADVFDLLSDLFSMSKGYLICNIASYKAMALLPNGENAHITVRSADWWLAIFEALSHRHPLIEVVLFISTNYGKADKYILKGQKIQDRACLETSVPTKRGTIELK